MNSVPEGTIFPANAAGDMYGNGPAGIRPPSPSGMRWVRQGGQEAAAIGERAQGGQIRGVEVKAQRERREVQIRGVEVKISVSEWGLKLSGELSSGKIEFPTLKPQVS